jgi:hypothetical protein
MVGGADLRGKLFGPRDFGQLQPAATKVPPDAARERGPGDINRKLGGGPSLCLASLDNIPPLADLRPNLSAQIAKIWQKLVPQGSSTVDLSKFDPSQIDPKTIDLDAATREVASWTRIVEMHVPANINMDRDNLAKLYTMSNIIAMARGESAQNLAVDELDKARAAAGLAYSRDVASPLAQARDRLGGKWAAMVDAHLEAAQILARRAPPDSEWAKGFSIAIEEFKLQTGRR